MKILSFFTQGYTEESDFTAKQAGNKGFSILQLAQCGVPTPSGFVVFSGATEKFFTDQDFFLQEIYNKLEDALEKLEKKTNTRLGSRTHPLLLSLSLSPFKSFPSLMGTILNIGLTTKTVMHLASESKNSQFIYDSYIKFIQNYAEKVKGINSHHMEDVASENKKKKENAKNTREEIESLNLATIGTLKDIYKEHCKEKFPEDPKIQFRESLKAALMSWENPRAEIYRNIHGISKSSTPAIIVREMVHGNADFNSMAGICLTRNPFSGEDTLCGELLTNAQGDELSAGYRATEPIRSLQEKKPDLYKQLENVSQRLETHFSSPQHIHFVIEKETLYILRARNAKMTSQAVIKTNVDFVKEGKLSEQQALLRVKTQDLETFLHPKPDPFAHRRIVCQGLPAAPGSASGRVVFTAADARAWAANGESVILVREETLPDDINGMSVACGILTAKGGMTSHAAVIARQMGKCCIVGCSSASISERNKCVTTDDAQIVEGDWITLDGNTGDIIFGKLETEEPKFSPEFLVLLNWAKKYSKIKVYANADTANDAKRAKQFGAIGIGLCRTEHMFFESSRLSLIRQVVFATESVTRRTALDKLQRYQVEDFIKILKETNGHQVTFRLLDLPLHEFLPRTQQDIVLFAEQVSLPLEIVQKRILDLQEENPMLGHRGCRLGVSSPEIYAMQVSAIAEAFKHCEDGENATQLQILLPLVSDAKEVHWLKEKLQPLAPQFSFGAMIELPRAALTAQDIAKYCDFFSFGTNDLTQTTYGLSRDDTLPFLSAYKREGLLYENPFATLDVQGVGELIQIACERGRTTKSELEFSVCGEHGGDPKSIDFFHKIGIHSVSCAPSRVPIALLAAAQSSFLNVKITSKKQF